MFDLVHEIQTFNAGRDRPAGAQISQHAAALSSSCAPPATFYRRLPDLPLFADAPAVELRRPAPAELAATRATTGWSISTQRFRRRRTGPASWDLVRFLTSVRVGAESMGVKDKDASACARLFSTPIGRNC